jgi:hypothetical protein
MTLSSIVLFSQRVFKVFVLLAVVVLFGYWYPHPEESTMAGKAITESLNGMFSVELDGCLAMFLVSLFPQIFRIGDYFCNELLSARRL